MVVVELHAEHRVRQSLDHLALEFDLVFLCHSSSPSGRARSCGGLRHCHRLTVPARRPAYRGSGRPRGAGGPECRCPAVGVREPGGRAVAPAVVRRGAGCRRSVPPVAGVAAVVVAVRPVAGAAVTVRRASFGLGVVRPPVLSLASPCRRGVPGSGRGSLRLDGGVWYSANPVASRRDPRPELREVPGERLVLGSLRSSSAGARSCLRRPAACRCARFRPAR